MTTSPTTEPIPVLDPEVVGAELAAVEKSAALPEDSAVALRGEFADYYNGIVTLRESAATVKKPDDATHQKIAREVRLGLRRIRCDVENTRKALKADSLARGKAIDGFANVLKYLCEPIEEKLLAVEQYAERQEAARVAALAAERTAALVAQGADPSSYNLGAMDDATWQHVLLGAYRIRKDREEAARQAEAERVAREQADRIAREKAEADAAEARALAEKERKAREASEAKAAKEREAADAALAKERAALEKAQHEADEARAKEQARIRAERDAQDAKDRAEKEEAERAARAPDRDKLLTLAAELRSTVIPSMKTAAGKGVAAVIAQKVMELAAFVERGAKGL
jgi:hypothetical protein